LYKVSIWIQFIISCTWYNTMSYLWVELSRLYLDSHCCRLSHGFLFISLVSSWMYLHTHRMDAFDNRLFNFLIYFGLPFFICTC
jgi:hypothetical protein